MQSEICRGRKTGFTLIELLVVIAIISILAAILFPVFARARENARRTSCLSNQKQLGLGMIQYAQDFDEKYPTINNLNNGAQGHYSWDIVIFPYVKSNQVYQCPSVSDKNTRAYSMNWWVSGNATGWALTNPTATLATISRAANTVLLLEQSNINEVPTTSSCYSLPSTYCYNIRGFTIMSFVHGGTSTTLPYGAYNGISRKGPPPAPSGGTVEYTGAGAGIHINDTFNVLYADGHAKNVKAGRPPTDGSFIWRPDGT